MKTRLGLVFFSVSVASLKHA